MKKAVLALIAVLLLAPALAPGNEGSGNVIVYTSYPNDVISYIYVIPVQRKETASGNDTKITYLKPPVFGNHILASRNYRSVLCTRYTICN